MARHMNSRIKHPLLFPNTLRGISRKLGPSFANQDNFNSYSTNCYKLTMYELQTGIKLLLLTDRNEPTENTKKSLEQLYSTVLYNYVIKSSIWTEIIDIVDDSETDCYKIEKSSCRSYFLENSIFRIEEFFRALPFYS